MSKLTSHKDDTGSRKARTTVIGVTAVSWDSWRCVFKRANEQDIAAAVYSTFFDNLCMYARDIVSLEPNRWLPARRPIGYLPSGCKRRRWKAMPGKSYRLRKSIHCLLVRHTYDPDASGFALVKSDTRSQSREALFCIVVCDIARHSILNQDKATCVLRLVQAQALSMLSITSLSRWMRLSSSLSF